MPSADRAPPPKPPRLPLKEQLRRAWGRLRGGELTPERAFWSIAIGLFVGVQPTPGLHFPVIMAICVPLRLDAAMSYVAANISIPPIAPFLWFASIQIGARILTGHFVPLSVEGTVELVKSPGPLLSALALGSITLGLTLGLLGGSIAYLVTRARRDARAAASDDGAAIERTVARYAPLGRSACGYVRHKLRRDPVVAALLAAGPMGEVLDLGCGRGQLALLLLERGLATRAAGRDWDAAKVDLATRASAGRDARFEQADLRDALPGGDRYDTVLLIDVLHYLTPAEQDDVLRAAAAAVRPGGRLLLREASLGYGWRSRITRLVERLSTFIRFNRGERVVFRDVPRELVPVAEGAGLRCEVEACWRGTPFANVLVVGRRPD